MECQSAEFLLLRDSWLQPLESLDEKTVELAEKAVELLIGGIL